MPSRDDAWKLLCEYTTSESLRKHMLAVEACVRAYAREAGADEELWELQLFSTTSTTNAGPTKPTLQTMSIPPKVQGYYGSSAIRNRSFAQSCHTPVIPA